MPDLKVQLAQYLDHVVERVDLEDILEERIGAPDVRPVPQPLVQRSSRGWVYALASAAVVLLLVGGLAWLARPTGEQDVVEQPPTTVAPNSDARGALGVIELGRVVPPRIWGTNRIAAGHGAIWVGVDETDFVDGVQPGALFRIDAETRQVTDEIEVSAGVIDIVSDSAALWPFAACRRRLVTRHGRPGGRLIRPGDGHNPDRPRYQRIRLLHQERLDRCRWRPVGCRR